MGESQATKDARRAQLAHSQLEAQREAEFLAFQKQLYGQISPFATGLLGAGQNALKGIAPDFFQLGTRNAIASAFSGQRQNLADFLGQSGQGFGGLAAGPAANLGAQESSAMGQSYADAIAQALGLGMQGGNILQGQQALFNPVQYGALAAQGFGNILGQPRSNILGQLLGSGLSAGLTAVAMGAGGSSGGGGGGVPRCCWVATELYGDHSREMLSIRRWLETSGFWMRPFVRFYRLVGPRWAEAIRMNRLLRRLTKMLFDCFLKQAGREWASSS